MTVKFVEMDSVTVPKLEQAVLLIVPTSVEMALVKLEKHHLTVHLIAKVVEIEYVKLLVVKLSSIAQKTVVLAEMTFVTLILKILVCVLRIVDTVETVSVMPIRERIKYHVKLIVVQVFVVMVAVLLANPRKHAQLIVLLQPPTQFKSS
jgi:hypothetical protein